MDRWEFDTEGDAEFPVLARGWAAEVMPDVLSPMTCSAFLPRYENAWRRYFVDTLPVVPPRGDARTFANVVGGRFYCNLSAFRRLGDISSSSTIEEMEDYFAPGVELPPYERPDEPGYEDRTQGIVDAGLPFIVSPPATKVNADFARARTLRAEGAKSRSSSTAPELLARIDSTLVELQDFCWHHLIVSGYARSCFSALRRGLGKLWGEEADAVIKRALSGLGTVESATPGHLIGRAARASEPERSTLVAELIDDHGFRGVNEWEIAAPSWEMSGDLLQRVIDRASAAVRSPIAKDGEATDARRRIQQQGLPRWGQGAMWYRAATFHVPNRERTKASCIITLNEVRLDVHEIGRRLVDADAIAEPGEACLLTYDELARVVVGDPVPSEAVDRRRSGMARLRALEEPRVVDVTNVPPLSRWPSHAASAGELPRSAESMIGRPGSPGRVVGRALVVTDPYCEPLPEPDEILVAPQTDPGWSHLFMLAAGAVVDNAGELSHAVVVARELGMPAVVGLAGCCQRITTGDLLEIDGSTGEVVVLRRATT